MLLRFADAASPALHEVEAFGPVASIVGYDSLDEAVRARGARRRLARDERRDARPRRSRSRSRRASPRTTVACCSSTATTRAPRPGHGSPLPNLVHGGPGRAGGGEELGGIRAVLHHMQRTAVQGSPEMLTALTGVWHAGAASQPGGVHPFRKSLAELRIGDQVVSASRTVTLEDIETFAALHGRHVLRAHGRGGGSREPVLPRPRRARLPARLVGGRALRGCRARARCSRTRASRTCGSSRPVSPGDSIRVELTAKQITPRETDEYGEVRWDAVLRNQDDELVATYDVLTLVAKELAPALTSVE